MKKTLIALSVLVAAGSVNAATVYQTEGFSADVFADMEVNYKQAVGAGQDAKFGVDDADFGFSATSTINDDLTVTGVASFNGNEAAQSEGVQIDNANVGLQMSNGMTVTFGRVVNFTDDLGNSTDEEIGGFYTASAGLATKTDQVVKLLWDNGDMFYAGFAVTGMADGSDATDDDSQFDIKAGLRFDNGEARVFYGSNSQAGAGAIDDSYMALEVDYSIDALSLYAHLSSGEQNNVDTDALGLAVAYTMDKTTLSVGYSTMDSGATDASQWYANANYALGTNTSVYAEIADTDVTGVDMGYAAGIRIKF